MRQPTNHELAGPRKASTRDQNKQCREPSSVERGPTVYFREKEFSGFRLREWLRGERKIREEPFYKGAQSFNIGIFKIGI